MADEKPTEVERASDEEKTRRQERAGKRALTPRLGAGLNATARWEAKMEVKRTERGWAGHFISADRCLFRRNTLLQYGDIYIVVSTVGRMGAEDGVIGFNPDFETGKVVPRYYETVAFYSHDVDGNRQIDFDSPWQIAELDADDKANYMHEAVVEELSRKLINGEIPAPGEPTP